MDIIINGIQALWKTLGDWLVNHVDSAVFLYMLQASAVMILLAIFLPKKVQLYKINLKRMLNRKVTDVEMSSSVRYLHGLTRTGVFKYFVIDDESEEYYKLESLIIKAGGLSGCTPDIIHMFKVLIPTLMFSALTAFYVVSVQFGKLKAAKTLIDTTLNSNTSGIMVVQNPNEVHIKFSIIFIILVLSTLTYLLPEKVIGNMISRRQSKLLEELPTVEMFMSIYLDAGYSCYDVLNALQDVVVYNNRYISECINEYYLDPEKALQNMADKINIPEYQIIIDILKQAVNTSGKFASSFIKQHMEQLNKLKDLAVSGKNKRKPLLYVFILAIPLINIVAIWFYPWVVKVTSLVNFTNMQ